MHACIALADAVLVAVEGARCAGENHSEAARRLRSWCSAKHLPERGIAHFEWLLNKKTHFSYDERVVLDEHLALAKVKMDQFFAWVLGTFPALDEITKEIPHA